MSESNADFSTAETNLAPIDEQSNGNGSDLHDDDGLENSADNNTDRSALPVDTEMPPRLPFPVVGIGASAGGLEAYTEFFKAMPADSGMAFVLIQHLPPDRESMIAEILARHTAMAVHQVEDGMSVMPNTVYVIRPGRTLTIKDGKLHLGERLEKPMHNRPVDDFFKSLAEEQRERGICIIFSGMGSNGSAGSQAIKAVGGLCIAQDPETAQFASMPRHLIDAGYADYVLRPADIPDTLLAYAGHPYATSRHTEDDQTPRREQQYLREILAMLRARTRHDFAGYKKPTVLRRVQRRMGVNRITKMADYVKLIRQSPTEITGLADDLLIHVTGFFRDPEAWKQLQEKVIVPLVASRQSDASIRCWVTACSSGEEAYTLAILLVEEMEKAGKHLDIKVFATDTAERTLGNARNGIYPGGIETDVSAERLERYFMREDAIYRVRPEVRERVIFAPQNVLQDPPFSRLDIVTCRNLLIYLEPAIQQRVLNLLHFGLREGGALFLGTSETVGSSDDLYEPLDKGSRIFRRVGQTRHGNVEFPLPHAMFFPRFRGQLGDEKLTAEKRPRSVLSIAQQTAKVLLEDHSPAAVTVDQDGRIVYFHGNTNRFLSQPRGEPTRDVLEMAGENVRGAIRTAFHRVAREKKRVVVPDGWLETEPGRRVRIIVTASPLDKNSMPGYYVISFEEREPAAGAESNTAVIGEGESADEIRRLRDELQSTIEELQTSNEEMKASNEEITSTNEELQSTNEELETSREEMQSLNEELHTVNAQLLAKMEEQQATTNHLSSLLSSTAIAVLFLDSEFKIRRFTPAMTDLIDLISTDVGRKLTDMAMKFKDPDLVADAESVSRNLVPIQREIIAEDGRWYMRRLTPYRTVDNRIEGVVITFVDISVRLKATADLADSEERYRLMVEEVRDYGIYMLNPDGKVATWNIGGERIVGYTADEMIGKHVSIMYTPEQIAAGQDVAELKAALADGHYSQERWHVRKDGTQFWASCVFTAIFDGSGKHRGFSNVMRDNTERRSADQTRLLLAAVVESSTDPVIAFTIDDNIVSWNPAAERVFGYTSAEALKMKHSSLVPPHLMAEFHSAMSTLERGESISQMETVRRRKDGTLIDVSITSSPLRHSKNDAGKSVAAAVLQEITERKLHANALADAKAAADAASRTKDDFLAIISHELRTPLSAILVWSNVLSSVAGDDSEMSEGLLAIRRSAESQKELIEDLLDSSRITTGQLRMQMRDIELLPLVREAVETVSPTAEAKEIDLEMNLSPDVGTVRADPDRLRQVIWNLLTNAVKFTPAGGSVKVGLARKGSEVRISVSDTGRGIEPEFLTQVFERFRQADAVSTRTHGGLGLGLSIVKQLVELHGGTIEAHSGGQDKGATFTVQLPLPKLNLPKGRSKPSIVTSAPTNQTTRLSGLRVLLVEDEVESRKAFAMVLGLAQMQVTAVGAVVPALQSFENEPPDLIISDIGLPDEDGYTLIRKIRERELMDRRDPIPAIALTAFASEQDRARALAAGFQQHLTKPVNPDQLTSAILSLLPVH